MKHIRVIQKITVFIFSAFISYFPAYIIVYMITWILNIFKPIPEGVDMYREANRLALEAFPDKHMVSVIAIVVGICIGTIFAFWWKPERFSESAKINHYVRKDAAFHSNEEDEYEQEPKHRDELKKANNSDDWFDHSLEDHDNEDGWCTECEEFEEDLDD
ncbi:MAG: hypothetical protein ACOYKJ_00420 [Candidatus Howiella sp.]